MNLIFDFNGTLSDSLEMSVNILNKFLEERKENLITKKDVRRYGLEYLAKNKDISNLSVFILLLRARSEISQHMDKISIFPRMVDIIKKLSKDNTLGIISSNSKNNIEIFLDKHGILNNFDFIDDEKDWFGKHKKIIKILQEKRLDKAKTFYIGDEVRDIKAAKKAGVKSVAVTWGYDSKENLKKFNPDFIIDNPIGLSSLK